MNTDKAEEKRLKLSKHFVARWRERFGGEPSLRTVRRIIREAVWLQRTHDMLFPVTGNPHRTLSIYVHFERQIALKVDEINGVVVTMVWAGPREAEVGPSFAKATEGRGQE